MLFSLLVTTLDCAAQSPDFSPFDARHWGVVLQDPNMDNVIVRKDITYSNDGKSDLRMDVYQPPKLKRTDRLPAVVFLNVAPAVGGRPPVKSTAGYSSWPRLIAAKGMIGISIEVGENVPASFDSLFHFLAHQGSQYNIDAEKLGVWAASANTIIAGNYLMKSDLYSGIRAAVLYYGFFPTIPLRRELPVLFVVSEGDIVRNEYQNIWAEVLKSKAPWTIKMASGMPHAFDIFSDDDQSRKIVKETISFWQNHLENVPQPEWKKSPEREIVEAQYWHDDNKIVTMMNAWFRAHPDTRDVSAYGLYIRSLLMVGNYAEAERALNKRMELEPDNSSILIDLTVVSHARGNAQDAEAYLAKYTNIAGVQRATYITVASSLFQIRKYQDAVKYFETALAMEARPATYYFIAICYAQMREPDKAFEALAKTIELGYGTIERLERDQDLNPLKTDPRWKRVLETLK